MKDYFNVMLIIIFIIFLFSGAIGITIKIKDTSFTPIKIISINNEMFLETSSNINTSSKNQDNISIKLIKALILLKVDNNKYYVRLYTDSYTKDLILTKNDYDNLKGIVDEKE